MPKNFNTVSLNLGLTVNDKPPLEGVSAVKIDNTFIHNVVAVNAITSLEGFTKITLTFHAKIGQHD